jgi:hypothetical protein
MAWTAILFLLALTLCQVRGDDLGRPFAEDPSKAEFYGSTSPAGVYEQLRSDGVARIGNYEIWCKQVNGEEIVQPVIKRKDPLGRTKVVIIAKTASLEVDRRTGKPLIRMKSGTMWSSNGNTGEFDERTEQIDFP